MNAITLLYYVMGDQKIFKYTVEPWLSKSPLSKSSVIRTLFQILKPQKTIWFSAKQSNKWNAYVIFRLARLIISYSVVQWIEKHISMYDYRPPTQLINRYV